MNSAISLIITFLIERFGSINDTVLKAAQALFYTVIAPKTVGDLRTYRNDTVNILVDHFAQLLQIHDFDPKAAMEEWLSIKMDIGFQQKKVLHLTQIWHEYMKDHAELYPNMLILIEIVLVLPLSASTCKNVHGFVKRARTDWRGSLQMEELATLMHIVTHGPSMATYDPSVAVNEWWVTTGEQDDITADLQKAEDLKKKKKRAKERSKNARVRFKNAKIYSKGYRRRYPRLKGSRGVGKKQTKKRLKHALTVIDGSRKTT